MKRNFILLSIAAACMSFISCNKGEDNIKPTGTQVFTAYADDMGATKSELGQDLEIYWKPNDTLQVFYSGGSVKCYTTITEPSKKATFYTKGSLDPQEKYWGLYPFSKDAAFYTSYFITELPSKQKGVVGTFDDGLFLTVAKSETQSLSFKNVCGCFKFQLSGELNDVTEVTFSGNNGEKIAGSGISIWFGQDGTPTHSGGDAYKIVLTPKTGTCFETGKDYYIVCMPMEFSKGFSLKIKRESNGWSARKTSKSYTLACNNVVDLGSQLDTSFSSIYVYRDEYTGEEEEGIMLTVTPNIIWAPFNVGGKDTLYYPEYIQWKEGGLLDYDDAEDACPAGWRLPTCDEALLFAGDGTASETYFGWRYGDVTAGYASGCYVYGNEEKTGDYLFFPACGVGGRSQVFGKTNFATVWCKSDDPYNKVYFLEMGNGDEGVDRGIKLKSEYPSDTFYRSVRCVQALP